MVKGKNITPLRTAIIYTVFGVLWILYTDKAVGYLIPATAPEYTLVQTIKGWLFVLASASLIYLILRRDMAVLATTYRELGNQARLIEDVSDAIIATDMQFHILTWNPAAENMYGWKASEVTGHSLNEFVQSEYINISREEIIQTAMEQGKWRGEVIQNHKNGRRFFISTSLSLIKDENEKPVGLIAVNRDIEERKLAEQELRASERRFRSLIENGLDNISLLAADGTLLWESPSTIRTLGYGQDAYKGRNIFELIHPEDASWVGEQFQRMLKEPGVAHMGTFRIHHISGEWRWIETIATNMLDEPSVNAVVINYRDITEKKMVEEKIREAEGRYRLISENSTDVIWTLDVAKQRFTYVSPSVFRLRGLTPKEVIAEPMSASMTPASYQYIVDHLPARIRAYMAGDDSVRSSLAEIDQVHKDGSIIPTEVVTTLITDANGALTEILGVTRDITERKQAEEHFSSAFHSSPTAITITRLKDGRVIDVNQAWCELFGYTREQAIGRSSLELGITNEATRQQVIERLKEKGILRNLEAVISTSNGEKREVMLSMETMNINGEASSLTTLIDITERKQAEALLKQSEQRYRLLFEEMPVAIWEEDFSRIREYLDTLKEEGITDFRTYFVEHSAAIVECANRIRIIGVNHSALKLYKAKSYAELIKHTDEEMTQLDLDRIHKIILDLADGITNGSWEGADETLDHEAIEISLSWSVVPGHEQDYSRIIVTTIDVTERKRAEEALRNSEARLREAQSVGRIGDWEYEPKTEQFYFSDEMYKLFELDPTVGRLHMSKALEYFHPEDAKDVRKNFQHALETGEGWDHDVRMRLPSGRPTWHRGVGEAVTDGQGNVIKIHGVTQDITERKRTARREQKKTQTLELLARGATLPMVLEAIVDIVENELTDSICSILLLDESRTHLLHGAAPGLPEFYNQAIHGQPVGMGQGSCGTAAYTGQRVIVQDITTHPYWENYRDVAKKAGLRSCWSQPIMASSGQVLGTFAVYHKQPASPTPEELEIILSVTSLASITIERKHAEQTIREYAVSLEKRVELRTAELMYANRAKDEFLANMSHELRTPLNSVLGFSESLLEGVRGPMEERQKQAVELIHSSGEHLLGLINDVLDVSKIDAGKFEIRPEVVSVNEICQSSLMFIKQLANKKSITVEYSVQPALATMHVDPKRLKQILVNLLNNAVKFTPEKGKVSLEVLADTEKKLMRFSISDTGIGIKPDDLEKLFKPFVQLDSSLSRQYEGTGLGLMLVKQLAELHGGTVQVQSEIGTGSCFIVELPWDEKENALDAGLFVEEGENEKSIPVTPSRSIENNRKRILLAEDNDANILMVRDYLENHGYQISVAHHGVEALEKAVEISPDLILMDIQMPKMDGLEATRRLRSMPEFATLPIIALTAFAMPGDQERCLEAGANEYLAKPVSLKRLLNLISEFLSI
jgi:PAS domain S-box-containing protein